MNTVFLELRMLYRNRLALAAAAAFALVMLLGAAGAWTAKAQADADKAVVAAAERERWLAQGNKDPHSAAHYSIHAFKPSLPLQALDPGIEPFVGQTVWLEAHVQNDMIYRPLQEAEPFQRAGLPDPSMLVMQFAPLLVILLAFAVTTVDREHGLLRMVLGAARQPQRYVAGKWSAVWLVCMFAVAVPTLPFGVAATLADVSFDNLARLVLWFMSTALYLGIIAAFAVAVCFASSTLRTGVAVLLSIWVVFVLAAPRVVSTFIDAAAPLPSFQEVKTQLENEAPAYWSAETAAAQTEILRGRYQVAEDEALPVDLRTALLDYNERHAQETFDHVLGDFYDQVEAQDRLFGKWSWLTPAIAFDLVSAALAGSDFAHHRDFIDAAERYRRYLVNSMNGELLANTPADGAAYASDGSMWAEIPEFDYTHSNIGSALANTGTAFIALLFWLGGALAALRWSARGLHP